LLRESIVNNASTVETILTGKKQDPTSINQNLSLYYTQSAKNIFAFEMQHLYQDENPFYNANLRTRSHLICQVIFLVKKGMISIKTDL
jgi:hypothetical protein